MLLPQVIYEDLNHISYQTAWDYQFSLLKKVIDHKIALKDSDLLETDTPSVSKENFKKKLIKTQQNYLLFCEHNPVYTLGKSGLMAHLLLDEAALKARNIEFFKINRGGDITYHGDGQITGYPIFDLDCFFTDVHKYVRSLEEVIIRTIAEYGLEGTRIEGFTGVWLPPKSDSDDVKYRKICAIGVHLSRWVTMHGFAFNVNTDLKYYDYIVPCGIEDDAKTVTSLARELGRKVDMTRVKEQLKHHFQDIFSFTFQ